MRPRALALTGPTASGKTDVALGLARRLDAEIISMDSRQVYRGMDIGTAKVTPAERWGVPHFGLDLVDPDESYSAGRWAREARGWVDEIERRGHVPLAVGGTGFFLRALLQPIFREPPLDQDRKGALRAKLDRMPLERLEAWVRVLDPARADTSVEGGRQRISRALEVALMSGRPLSWWHRHAPVDGPAVACLVVCLEVERAELDRRIDQRVSTMVERGFVDEVAMLLEAGFGPDTPGMTGTGYRAIAEVVRGKRSLSEALDEVRRQTRRYARRQVTWFRNQLPADTLRLDAAKSTSELVARIEAAWHAAVAVPSNAHSS